jgi:hypothetical protein
VSDAFTRFVARYTPHFLILFFVLAIAATVVTNGPLVDNLFYGCWLLIAAAVLTRVDIYMEGRQ